MRGPRGRRSRRARRGTRSGRSPRTLSTERRASDCPSSAASPVPNSGSTLPASRLRGRPTRASSRSPRARPRGRVQSNGSSLPLESAARM
jgi:hypothetical protein